MTISTVPKKLSRGEPPRCAIGAGSFKNLSSRTQRSEDARPQCLPLPPRSHAWARDDMEGDMTRKERK